MTELLVIDDDPGILDLLKRHLVASGYSVTACAEPFGALEYARTKHFDAVISDFKMGGGIDGLELCRRIRAHKPKVPIVLITGYGSMDIAIEAIRVGVSDFIRKPIQLDYLMDTLERVTNPSEADPAPEVTAIDSNFVPAEGPFADGTDTQLLPSLDEIERRHILKVLSATGGNKVRAARILGFDRRTLYRKLEQYGYQGFRRSDEAS